MVLTSFGMNCVGRQKLKGKGQERRRRERWVYNELAIKF